MRHKSAILLMAAGIVIGTLIVSPASAHISTSTWHLWTYHIKPAALGIFYTKGQSDTKYAAKSSLYGAGTMNAGSNPVHWTKLRGVPAGIADGVDSVGAGDIAGVTAGNGITGGGLSGNVVLALMSCSVNGQILKWNTTSGWGCAAEAGGESAGDITAVTAGSGLTGGGTTGDVSLAVSFTTSGGVNGTGTTVARGNHNHDDRYSDLRAYCKRALLAPRSYSSRPCRLINTVATGAAGYWSAIAMGSDGLPVISYQTGAASYDLMVAKCANPACSGGTTITNIDSAGAVGAYSSIAVREDGLPVISYADETNDDLKVVFCGNPACSSGNTVVVADSSVVADGYSSIGIKEDGYGALISYYDATNGALRLVSCSGSGSCGAPTVLDNDGDVGKYNSMAIGTSGWPVIAYYDLTNADLKVLKCADPSCSSGNTITTVDSAGSVGTYPSIAIGTDYIPVLSYNRGAYEGFKVAKCMNSSCSSVSTTTVFDSTANVGRTKLTIDFDGSPVVAYHLDEGSDKLKMVKCADANCATGSISTVDDGGFAFDNVGEYPSIAIGIDGFPMISYRNATNGELKVARRVF